jgi:hypothetical protein
MFFLHLNLKDHIEFYALKIEKHSNLDNKLNKRVDGTKQTQ